VRYFFPGFQDNPRLKDVDTDLKVILKQANKINHSGELSFPTCRFLALQRLMMLMMKGGVDNNIKKVMNRLFVIVAKVQCVVCRE